jgi:GNAT superfamily N-acetyltransferase
VPTAPAAADVTIRPMRLPDARAVADAAHTTFLQMYPLDLGAEEEELRAADAVMRMEHLLATDPGGCWIAEARGEVVGAALAIRRDDLWGLSLFVMLPAYQGLGAGTRLYEPALAYGEDLPGGLILSSHHPAALRRYARSPGFALQPSIGLSGAWDPRRLPALPRARPGELGADADTIDAASRHVRGASHAADLPTLLARTDMKLLVIEGEGFACVRHGCPALLAARSDDAASELLWASLASGPRGATVEVSFVTAANQWAIQVALEAGLAVSDHAAVFVRGEPGTMAPYLPSGAYL